MVHAFGEPDSVLSRGDVSHVSTVYRYERGPADVTAEGGWLPSEAWPFTMRLRVRFERAIAVFDLADDPQLRVYRDDGVVETPSVTAGDGWQAEIQEMVRAVAASKAGREAESPATMASAVLTTRVLEAEAKSLRTGQETPVDTGRVTQRGVR